MFHIGWSLDSRSTQLGGAPFSCGYRGTQKFTNSLLERSGDRFVEKDVTGCFVDFECGNDVELSFTKIGKWMGTAFQIQKEALGGQALYPHVLMKSCVVAFNFGQWAKPFCSILPGFTFIWHLSPGEHNVGAFGPKSKVKCEILMLAGLLAASKTTWAIKHAACSPFEKLNLLDGSAIVDETQVNGLGLSGTTQATAPS